MKISKFGVIRRTCRKIEIRIHRSSLPKYSKGAIVQKMSRYQNANAETISNNKRYNFSEIYKCFWEGGDEAQKTHSCINYRLFGFYFPFIKTCSIYIRYTSVYYNFVQKYLIIFKTRGDNRPLNFDTFLFRDHPMSNCLFFSFSFPSTIVKEKRVSRMSSET